MIRSLTQTTRSQVQAALAGLTEAQADSVSNPQAMSAKTTLLHLAECARAALTMKNGGEHEWGTGETTAASLAEANALYRRDRDALDQALSGEIDEKTLSVIGDFIVLHEAYHVGQLCTLRLSLDPAWDAYSIYR